MRRHPGPGAALWLLLCAFSVLTCSVAAMTPMYLAQLRDQTAGMFYHGFGNYMRHAFPEDELRPVACRPLTRDSGNPHHVGLNDVLGNYSLTLIDSLSTLAILAGSSAPGPHTGARSLADFQTGVEQLVQLYGDGRAGASGQGTRARGFDLDSKVQVFETVIRGVGGLLSAHLFAVGELPIPGYDPAPPAAGDEEEGKEEGGEWDPLELRPIGWPGGFRYDGQLLRLALDLAERLLPAFYTKTGLPYPRVNLRHGIPFYANSPLHGKFAGDSRHVRTPGEVTETCSAGAGSLVLEFTVLSRLAGDARFEQAAKRAFWAVWERRSTIGLVGNGIDAEEGYWIGVMTGIGAGVDSFFEYALKSHILLAGHDQPPAAAAAAAANTTAGVRGRHGRPRRRRLDPNMLHPPLSPEQNSADSFLHAWHRAHAAIKRYLYSDEMHPHYLNGHRSTGSPVTQWIDSLGAFYPGLLALAGELEEAVGAQLLYTALWTRYAALPERWSLRDGNVEGGLGWWPGRPEFVESTYYLYRATRDPWYLYVGEMVMRDIKRRCWTACGWSGLQDVRTGEKSDRMESFFLGETTKYMYLLFDPDHALNRLDAAYVFTTEGHPLVIPTRHTARPCHSPHRPPLRSRPPRQPRPHPHPQHPGFANSCPASPPPPLTGSATAARPDIFHAASLVGLHDTPNIHGPVEAMSVDPSPGSRTTPARYHPKTNHTFFPWTLPPAMLPGNGTCAKLPSRSVLRLEFPSGWGGSSELGNGAFADVFRSPRVVRAGQHGVEVLDFSGLRLSLTLVDSDYEVRGKAWRVSDVNGTPLGRDELVFMDADRLNAMMDDPLFGRKLHDCPVEVVLAVETPPRQKADSSLPGRQQLGGNELDAFPYRSLFRSLIDAVTSALDPGPATKLGPREEHLSSFSSSSSLSSSLSSSSSSSRDDGPSSHFRVYHLPAALPTGPGAAPPPPVTNAPAARPLHDPASGSTRAEAPSLSWGTVYVDAGDGCTGVLPEHVPRTHQVIVMRRGGCDFVEKLASVPDFAAGPGALKLVLVVDDTGRGGGVDPADHSAFFDHDPSNPDGEPDRRGPEFVQPLVERQVTRDGRRRAAPIPMVLVYAGRGGLDRFRAAKGVGIRRKYYVESQGYRMENVKLT